MQNSFDFIVFYVYSCDYWNNNPTKMNHCGKDMKFIFTDIRGRWTKDTYICTICGERIRKRTKLIANRRGRW